jgi:DNA sulfur modification protein DndE
MIETVRLSEKAKNQLSNLKRKTGIPNWNALCRWAFCISLSEPSIPPDENIVLDSSIEMTWKTFTGGRDEIYWGLLLVRAKRDGIELEREAIGKYFRLHLHRGISFMNGSSSIRKVDDLARLAVSSARTVSQARAKD